MSNLFQGLPRADEPPLDHAEEDQQPRESPFMGNHIVKTVRNLKKLK